MSPIVKLVATPLSHFARKSRILLDLYKVPYDFVEIVGNIAFTKTPLEVAGNPLMKIPVLHHGDEWIIESDHISSYIVSLCDKSDKYRVNSQVVFDLNAKAMLNGIMDEELRVIVGARHGVPVKEYEYFNKSVRRVDHGLKWLEDNHAKFNAKSPTYKEFHLISCWDHLDYYNFVPNMSKLFPHLNDIVHEVSDALPDIKKTAPLVMVPKK